MKKKLILILAGCVILLAVAIVIRSRLTVTDLEIDQLLKDERVTDFEIIKDRETSFFLEETFFDQEIFSSPTGILINDENIFIVDSKRNCVLQFDMSGSFLREIGSTGNGQLQFIAPHQIRFFDGQYYILDSGNNRIQILNEDFSFFSERNLNSFKDIDYGSELDLSYCDFDIDKEGNIYVSVLAMLPSNTHIYKIDQNGVVYQIGDDLVGYLSALDGDIYFSNHRKVITGKEKGKVNTYYMPYDTYLYKIEDDKLRQINSLPFKYSTVNFTFDEQNLFLYSDEFFTLDCFDKNGNYLSTLYEFEPNTNIRYLAYDKNGDAFFAASPENAKVYYLKNKE